MSRLLLLLGWLCCSVAAAAPPHPTTGVYVGGHIRRERPNTITNLKNSGFTYAILFNVNVEPDGTLTTDGETICKDGTYVFANTQPHYVDDVKELKAWPTGISRIEICIGGWGNESYSRIRDLINKEGIGSNSILYRNFKALKEAIPEIDAVNNDDEHCYDSNTAVRFHVMMSQLGYKTTVAPYTNKAFWERLVTQLNQSRPGACDRVLIQCYDGGAYNNPSDWHFGDIPLHAGRTNYQSDMQASINQMQTWRDQNGVTGAFVWVYNDETWNLNQWASAMNRIFPSMSSDDAVATFYSDNNFGGYAVSLPVGEYGTGQLAAYGITNRDIQSFRLTEGYQLTAYITNDLTGVSKSWTDAEMERMGAWGNRISSLKIELIDDESAISDPVIKSSNSKSSNSKYYDLLGRQGSTSPGLRIVNGKKIIYHQH
ncbi:MAG: hypothetical protein II949_05070 [Prevotella sp.]|nr:hypothetical protein [Prevotella sp.]